jgi:hypothetical protein
MKKKERSSFKILKSNPKTEKTLGNVCMRLFRSCVTYESMWCAQLRLMALIPLLNKEPHLVTWTCHSSGS